MGIHFLRKYIVNTREMLYHQNVPTLQNLLIYVSFYDLHHAEGRFDICLNVGIPLTTQYGGRYSGFRVICKYLTMGEG